MDASKVQFRGSDDRGRRMDPDLVNAFGYDRLARRRSAIEFVGH